MDCARNPGRGTASEEADGFSFAIVMVEVRHEWVYLVEPLFTTLPYRYRYLLEEFLSMTP